MFDRMHVVKEKGLMALSFFYRWIVLAVAAL